MKQFFSAFFSVFGFITAILSLIIIIGILKSFSSSNDDLFYYYKGDSKSNNEIAILKIDGPIISQPMNFNNIKFIQSFEVIYPNLIEKYLSELNQRNIKGLIISINSPGGSVSATKKIYDLFVEFKKNNNIPIYFHTSNLLASGGYWLALASDKIYASYGALIGSIGVKGPDWIYYNKPTSLSSGLLGSTVESPRGIKLFSNSAGTSKDLFNPFRPPNEKETEKLQLIVNDIYNDFVSLTSSSRKIESEIIINDIGAMIFNTKRAKENFLIDGEHDLDKVSNILIEKLKLKNFKIINNNKITKYNFFSLMDSNILFKYFFSKDYETKIISQFCNNLKNELNAVSITAYNNYCNNWVNLSNLFKSNIKFL